MIGLSASIDILPSVFAKVGQDELNYYTTDPQEMEKMFKTLSQKMKALYKETPQIKTMIAGNFMDVIDRGIIKA